MDTNIDLKNGEVSVISENGTTLIMNVDTLLDLIDKLESRENKCDCTCKTGYEKEECTCKCDKSDDDTIEDASGYIKLLNEILNSSKDDEELDNEDDEDDVNDKQEENESKDEDDTVDFSDAIMSLFDEIMNIVSGKNNGDAEEPEAKHVAKEKTPSIIAFEYHIPKHFDPNTYDFRTGIGDVVGVWNTPKDAMDEMNDLFDMALKEENITNIADSWESIGNLLHDGVIDEVKTGLSSDIKEYYEYVTGNKYPHAYTHLYTVNHETGEAFVFMWADSNLKSHFAEEILDMKTPAFEEEYENA